MDETTVAPEEVVEQPAQDSPRVPLWEDFLDIFYAPTKVFERRNGAGFGLVLFLVVVLMAVFYFAMQHVLAGAFQAEMQRGFEAAAAKGNQMTPEQMAAAQKMGSTFGLIGFVIATPIAVFLVGVLLWAFGKMFGSAATLSGAVLIATYAQLPKLLGEIAAVVEGLVSSPPNLMAASFSPARFLDPETARTMLMLAARFDVFVLWSTVLLAIGLHVIGKVPKAQAYFTAFLVWVVAFVPTLIGAAMGRM
ncbi:MAG TPA: Yip1 family protein [Longimicrobiaceae bacterium]|nr:Yip1 family protein [Longimicrobiaceae bacterium]